MEKTLKEDKATFRSIKALGDTEGGKELQALLVQQIMSYVHQLSVSDADPLCAKLQANIALLRMIISAEDNEKAVDELIEEALQA